MTSFIPLKLSGDSVSNETKERLTHIDLDKGALTFVTQLKDFLQVFFTWLVTDYGEELQKRGYWANQQKSAHVKRNKTYSSLSVADHVSSMSL